MGKLGKVLRSLRVEDCMGGSMSVGKGIWGGLGWWVEGWGGKVWMVDWVVVGVGGSRGKGGDVRVIGWEMEYVKVWSGKVGWEMEE